MITSINITLKVVPIDMDKLKEWYEKHSDCKNVEIGFHQVPQCNGLIKLFAYMWCPDCPSKCFIYKKVVD